VILVATSRTADWLRRIVPGRKGPRPDIDPPEIAAIYARAASEGAPERNPVIFIPGIMGTKLVDADATQTLWGEFPRPWRGAKEAEFAAGIALPMEIGRPLDQLHGTVRADGSVGQVTARLAGLPVELRAYGDIMSAIGVGSYRGTYASGSRHEPEYGAETHAISFEFSYDWRWSLDETAARLGDFMRLAARFVQARRKTTKPVCFDVVAHSMGGLVLRYFLRFGGQRLAYDGSLPKLNWAGAELVDMAVIVGTPSAGSLMVFERLVSGLPRNPVHPEYDPIVCGTMPSLYQLLPRSRHRPVSVPGAGNGEVDILDPAVWQEMEWGLASPRRAKRLAELLPGCSSAAERHDIAADHQEKCLRNARAFHDALDLALEGHEALEIHLVAGDAYKTPAVATAKQGEDRVTVTRFGPGDGTVLRSSALMDERLAGGWSARLRSPIDWDSITFIRSNHMGLTRDPVFINNVLYLLLEKPRRKR
jgi:pimeloyl-ACP methyl ester carboxylesterase